MVTIYKPKYEDLWFRAQMLADEETMAYNHAWGGTISFPKEDWRNWYDYWLVNHDDKRFYRYVKFEEEFVGEVAYHFDKELKGFIANVIIFAKYRNRGFGKQALDVLCNIVKEKGINSLYDDIAIDNPAISLFIKCGFKEEYRTTDKIILKKDL